MDLRAARFNIVKMSTFLKLTYRFSTIPIKTSGRFFLDIDKIIPKLKWKDKGTRRV